MSSLLKEQSCRAQKCFDNFVTLKVFCKNQKNKSIMVGDTENKLSVKQKTKKGTPYGHLMLLYFYHMVQ